MVTFRLASNGTDFAELYRAAGRKHPALQPGFSYFIDRQTLQTSRVLRAANCFKIAKREVRYIPSTTTGCVQKFVECFETKEDRP